MKTCEAPDCDKSARSNKAAYCEMHYYRNRRNGNIERKLKTITVNETFFDHWSNEMAWVLGLLWSDGCVHKNQVTLVSKDLDLLEQVATLMELKGGLYNKGTKYWMLCFYKTYLTNQLRKLGLYENKSLTVGWPVGMPTEHEHAFVRGIIDGDGCIALQAHRTGPRPVCRIQIASGSKKFATSLAECLRLHGMKAGLYTESANRKNPLYMVVVCSEASLRVAKLWLYPNDYAPRLVRKFKKLEHWCSLPKPKIGRKFSCHQPII